MAVSGMRGLSVFISDIRNCQNKEQERARVDKELANIRTRFKSERGMTAYEKKKYVWKMLYVYMLGYDVDFGHVEAIALISAQKYAEKQVGYVVTACLLNENNEFLRMVINTIRNDIVSRNETFQCLALTMVANVGGKEFSESLAGDVQKLLISSACRSLVRKKAALCLLRLFRKNPDVVNVEGWSDRMSQLLDERDLGVLTAVMSLLIALVAASPDGYWNCVPKCVRILERLARSQDIPQEYTYYGIPSPWLQYLGSADFAIREELALKAAILAEKFAPDLSWYVDVILQLIEKAGDFVSDDIWYRVVQFVTNNDDLQPYAAGQALMYIAKPAVHETMVKASGYLLGEFGHLLARQPGCSPKEIFGAIHEKFSTVSTTTKALLLSSYVKLLMHTTNPDRELVEQVFAVFRQYQRFVDAEVQQRAVEYLALGRRGHTMADILAEMPKFPERESALLKKAEDVEDTADMSAAVRLRSQQPSTAIVISEQRPAAVPNGGYPAGRQRSMDQYELNGPPARTTSAPPPSTGAVDLLDLMGTPAIEAAPVESTSPPPAVAPAAPAPVDPFALAIYEPPQPVQPTGSIAEWFRKLSVGPNGILYEDPFLQIGVKSDYRAHQGKMALFLGNKHTGPLTNIQLVVGQVAGLRMQSSPAPQAIPPRAQIQVPIDILCVQPPREVPTLDCGYSNGQQMVTVKLRLPVVLGKFLVPQQLPMKEFLPRWNAATGPPLKLQEVLRNVKPLPMAAFEELLTSLKIGVIPGMDPNKNNVVAASALYAQSGNTLCLIRIETDPTDRTQLRLTVASQDGAATSAMREYIVSNIVDKAREPTVGPSAAEAAAAAPQSAAGTNDILAELAGLVM
ncbi:hypothetical protein CBR_g29503 [Chara braunii]|uniref:Clathrin adaptor alpha/beta/gamma-adaptin appendage Ig-like subdomain domain-containing protein n=1 Tax=Chara braunii TaxID=69332 RepID=A0A388LAL0_CHABU|nr:hypothetical protein CBR_g29503 [Chara braunii]|eukprot:GBG79355.1 hypothetical protein CBR_g29503 [Chara braunii]